MNGRSLAGEVELVRGGRERQERGRVSLLREVELKERDIGKS